jgi:Tfp pilus assembly protein PilE
VIIGVLASIVVGRFREIKARAYVSALKTDLKNLSSMQESYFYANNGYTSSLSALNFVPSNGVVISVSEATAGGWSAVASHPAAGAVTCAVYYGGASAIAPATAEGVMNCQ